MDSSLYDTVVYIKVAAQHKKFCLHKGLLCDVSASFKCALTAHFKEAQEGVIDLVDEDPKIFERFNSWLYTGGVLSEGEELDLGSWSFLIELYIFAEKRIIPSLQDLLLDTMIHLHLIKTCSMNLITTYWSRISSTSRLRSFLVDTHVYHVDLKHWFQSRQTGRQLDSSEIEFAVAIISRYDDISREQSITVDLWKFRCLWHVHDHKSPCVSGKE